MVFRIGINLGDVLVEGERIYGDGVNIAARLEGLAEGAGICLSGTAYDQVKNKLALGYDAMGEHAVKNIADPVRVYRIRGEPVPVFADDGASPNAPWTWRRWVVLGLAVLALIGVTAFWYIAQTPAPSSPPVATTKQEPTPPSDKPSIAVLPFTNMSGDPQQAYFADGMTDDLITDLSKLSGLFVIARNSTFAYKGQSPDVRQVGQDLGVRYVLEGSIRRSAEQVRINAQLIDATTGGHLWAERYDNRMNNVFELQDTITSKIVAALAVTLTTGDRERLDQPETENIAAYDAFLQGWDHFRRNTPKSLAEAMPYFDQALQLDPDYPRVKAALAAAYGKVFQRSWFSHLGLSREEVWERYQTYLKQALEYPIPLAHSVAVHWLVYTHRYEDAIAEAERAIALDPNDLAGHLAMAKALRLAGRAAEAVPILERTMRLDPHYPAGRLASLGHAYFGMEQYDKAASFSERAIKRNPTLSPWVLAATYGHLGRTQEAVDMLETYRKTRRWPTLPSLRQLRPYYPYQHLRDWERLAEGLRRVGVMAFKREHIAQSLHRTFCAQDRLLQETDQTEMLPYEEARQKAVRMIEKAISQLDEELVLGVLTPSQRTLLVTFKRHFKVLQHLSIDVTSRALLAETPAEAATARELAAGKGQAAFDTAAATWTQLAEQLGSPYIALGKLTGASCDASTGENAAK